MAHGSGGQTGFLKPPAMAEEAKATAAPKAKDKVRIFMMRLL
jgi:hypothetical protein